MIKILLFFAGRAAPMRRIPRAIIWLLIWYHVASTMNISSKDAQSFLLKNNAPALPPAHVFGVTHPKLGNYTLTA